MSKFESPSVSSGRRTSTTVVIGSAAGGCGGRTTGSGSPFFQPSGGLTITIPPHLGQARICPIADSSRTFSRDLQVVQEMEKRSIGCNGKWTAGEGIKRPMINHQGPNKDQ
jgi:hypothetical protein